MLFGLITKSCAKLIIMMTIVILNLQNYNIIIIIITIQKSCIVIIYVITHWNFIAKKKLTKSINCLVTTE